MQIEQLPVLSDNYIFLCYDPSSHQAAVVDPTEASPVLERLQTLNAELIAIFNTHHHWDHVGGNTELLRHFPQLTVYGGAQDRGRIPGQTVFLQGGDSVSFGEHRGQVFFIPGHTKAHIAYYFPPLNQEEWGDLFCGDTLFSGGCGRLFEGTPALMVDSLSQLRRLPDRTRVWCAHEYTLNNLKFALTVEPENQELQQYYQEVENLRNHGKPTIPSSIKKEKEINPFFRWDYPSVQQTMNTQDPIQTFARLRGRKDQF